MKANYRVNPDLMIELEAANQKDLFAAMAMAAEVFGSHWTRCGKCRDATCKPKPVVRLNKNKESFYELHCTNPECRARFAFGQGKDMKTLFPQRKFPKGHARKGEYKPDEGWVKWNGSDEDFRGSDEGEE